MGTMETRNSHMLSIEQAELETFVGTDAAILEDYRGMAHVGGLSAAIHHMLTTAMPNRVHIRAVPEAVMPLAEALEERFEDVPVSIQPRPESTHGIGTFRCDGKIIRASLPARAAAEVLMDDVFCSKEDWIEVYTALIGSGVSEEEMLCSATMFGDECVRRLNEVLVSCKET